MKTMKKLSGLLLALAIALALTVPAMAGSGEEVSESSAAHPDTPQCTITIEMPYGINLFDENTYTYTLTKIFDVTIIGTEVNYKLLKPIDENHGLPTGFIPTAGDYVGYDGDPEPDIPSLVQYINDYTILPTYTITVHNGDVSGAEGAKLTHGDPNLGTCPKITVPVEPGYYYIDTTTGSAVVVDSLTPYTTDAKVTDKNSVPTVKKVITDDRYEGDDKDTMVQAGDTVYFSVTITVGKGTENYVLHDVMDDGLRYNGDMEVYIVDTDRNKVRAEEDTWELKDPPDAGDTLTVVFHENYPEGYEIVVNYSATVTIGQAYEDTAANTVYVSYDENNKTAKDTVEVYTAKVTISKVDGNNAPLSGAGFVLRNDNPGDFEGMYYKLNPADESHGKGPYVTWIADMDDATIDVQSMTINGKEAYGVEFPGLDAGVYTLIENKVPEGYNKAGDKTFTISKENIVYSDANVEETESSGRELLLTVVNNAGTELPDTGGIGTTIFTVAGGALMLGAAVLFITKKRSSGD